MLLTPCCVCQDPVRPCKATNQFLNLVLRFQWEMKLLIILAKRITTTSYTYIIRRAWRIILLTMRTLVCLRVVCKTVCVGSIVTQAACVSVSVSWRFKGHSLTRKSVHLKNFLPPFGMFAGAVRLTSPMLQTSRGWWMMTSEIHWTLRHASGGSMTPRSINRR